MRIEPFGRIAVVFLFIYTSCEASQVTTLTTKDASSSLTSVPSTCPSRSINYITQSLPQQCLTSSWSSKPSPQATENDTHLPSVNSDTTAINASSTIVHANQGAETTFSRSDTKSYSTFVSVPTISDVHPASDTPIVAASRSESSGTTQESALEGDTDSPLDNANFLSFEDWKIQNLAKVGQSAENFESRDGAVQAEQRRRPGQIHNALDSLGEDSEIDIDFRGFVNPGSLGDELPTGAQPSREPAKNHDHKTSEEGQADKTSPRRRSKDAGKTCKERSNYASFDCAATVLKTNPECKGSTSVLVENKDSYMLNVCSVKNKFFIVELCNDILVDTVVLANFEFFSSMFRRFRVSVSDRYPVKLDKWRDLGEFEARSSRDMQAFLIENPLIWARYLRIEFLTHYGNEYYCPVSLLRVHGTTMMEEFNHEMKGLRGEDESELEGGETENEDTGPPHGTALNIATATTNQASHTPKVVASSSPDSHNAQETQGASSEHGLADSVILVSSATTTSNEIETALSPTSPSRRGNLFEPVSPALQCDSSESLLPTSSPTTTAKPASQSHALEGNSSETVVTSVRRSDLTATSESSSSVQHASSALPSNSLPSAAILSKQYTAQGVASTFNQTASSTSRSLASVTHANNPNPTTQESFFKSVHKRLQQLEANSTLSLQYIEEQSRILRDAFSKVEKRQLAKTSGFLETLNSTVLTELRDFRMQYDQIWQSTVLELSSQREQSQLEMSALSKRLNFLADEVIFQKRVTVLQFMLILLCLGFVIFPRHGSQPPFFELPPLVQSAFNKSSSSLARVAHYDSPPASPPSTRPASRYGIFRSWAHARSPSEDSDLRSGPKSPTVEFSPPTPESLRSVTDPADSSSREGSRSPSESSPSVRHRKKGRRSLKRPVVFHQGPRSHEGPNSNSPSTPKASATFSNG